MRISDEGRVLSVRRDPLTIRCRKCRRIITGRAKVEPRPAAPSRPTAQPRRVFVGPEVRRSVAHEPGRLLASAGSAVRGAVAPSGATGSPPAVRLVPDMIRELNALMEGTAISAGPHRR